MLISIPDEIQNAVKFSKNSPVPILKKAATDQQKIIYADFISELFADRKFNDFYFETQFLK